MKSGITLIDALSAIVDQVEGEKMKRVFGNVKTDVNEGSSLADALGKHDAIFDHLYVSMVRAGEASGALDEVLTRLADFTEAQARLQSKIMSAMLYPVIMVGVGSVIMLVLFVVVIPKVTKIFDQVKAQLPLQTKFLIGTADLIKGWWFVLFPALFLFIFLFFRWKSSKRGRPIWDRFALKAPLFGFIVRLVAIARFSRTLATLLRAGVPVLNALDITKDVLGNVRLADVVSEARDAIREGESIAQPLKRSGEFPPIVVHMIATGESSGQLEQMLEHVADNYDLSGGAAGRETDHAHRTALNCRNGSRSCLRCLLNSHADLADFAARALSVPGDTMQTNRPNHRNHRRPRRKVRGLTLIEILVVVTILGLIAGIVGVAVIGQLEEAQVDTTKTQIANLSDSLDIYKMKFGKYPTSTEGLGALESPPNGRKPIIESVPKDPWGGDYVYISPGQHNPSKFDIYSKGPDQQGGTGDDITNWSK